MKTPLKHVARSPLPWHEFTMTECGRAVEDVGDWVPRDEARRMSRELGKTRSMMIFCVTCVQAGNRAFDWEHEPVGVLARWIEPHRWGRRGMYNDAAADYIQMDCELRAVAQLIDNHREEFDTTVEALRTSPFMKKRWVGKKRSS